MGERQALYHLGNRRRHGPGRFHEIEPRRRREKQVAHLDPRARSQRYRPHRSDDAPFHRDFERLRGAPRPRRQRQPCSGADRGERLAAKPECADVVEAAVQLGRRVALDPPALQFIPDGMPSHVVGDPDQRDPAGRRDDLDAAGMGIQRVFGQLLDHARRALDHLARRDAVDDLLAETRDGHGGGTVADSAGRGKPASRAPRGTASALPPRPPDPLPPQNGRSPGWRSADPSPTAARRQRCGRPRG